jgi:hypothetical protein
MNTEASHTRGDEEVEERSSFHVIDQRREIGLRIWMSYLGILYADWIKMLVIAVDELIGLVRFKMSILPRSSSFFVVGTDGRVNVIVANA